MFVDEIKLSVHSGAGGSGSVSFKKISSKSSPSGGSHPVSPQATSSSPYCAAPGDRRSWAPPWSG